MIFTDDEGVFLFKFKDTVINYVKGGKVLQLPYYTWILYIWKYIYCVSHAYIKNKIEIVCIENINTL